MKELVGRLTALDPEASEALKVVAYFDALVAGGAGLDSLLRGAAALSGVIAGAERRGRISRRGPDGANRPENEEVHRSPQKDCSAGTVWLERTGKHHANDEMIVERLALALDLFEARRAPVGDLEIIIDPARSTEERSRACESNPTPASGSSRADPMADEGAGLRQCSRPATECCGQRWKEPPLSRHRRQRAWEPGCGPTAHRIRGTRR